MLDRVSINRELGRALAYVDCGKHIEAASAAFALIRLLDQAGVINAVESPGHLMTVERPERAK